MNQPQFAPSGFFQSRINFKSTAHSLDYMFFLRNLLNMCLAITVGVFACVDTVMAGIVTSPTEHSFLLRHVRIGFEVAAMKNFRAPPPETDIGKDYALGASSLHMDLSWMIAPQHGLGVYGELVTLDVSCEGLGSYTARTNYSDVTEKFEQRDCSGSQRRLGIAYVFRKKLTDTMLIYSSVGTGYHWQKIRYSVDERTHKYDGSKMFLRSRHHHQLDGLELLRVGIGLGFGRPYGFTLGPFVSMTFDRISHVITEQTPTYGYSFGGNPERGKVDAFGAIGIRAGWL